MALTGRIVRCILFDLGGTLWYRNKAIWPQLEAVANQHTGVLLRKHVAPESLPTLDEGELGNRLRKELTKQYRELLRRDPTTEPNGAYLLMQIFLQWGIPEIDPAFCTEIFEALRIPEGQSRILFEDTHSTLAALQERGFQLGVATNRLWGGKPFIEAMEELDLLQYFDPAKVAVSGNLGVRKPAPAIFLHALNAHNVVPEQAVMVGDLLSADVIGPQQLNMLSVWRPGRSAVDMVRVHLARQGLSIQTYDAQQVSLLDSPVEEGSTGSSPEFESSMADILNEAAYWHRFTHGDIKPDLIIEHLGDLLDVFLQAGEE